MKTHFDRNLNQDDTGEEELRTLFARTRQAPDDFTLNRLEAWARKTPTRTRPAQTLVFVLGGMGFFTAAAALLLVVGIGLWGGDGNDGVEERGQVLAQLDVRSQQEDAVRVQTVEQEAWQTDSEYSGSLAYTTYEPIGCLDYLYGPLDEASEENLVAAFENHLSAN